VEGDERWPVSPFNSPKDISVLSHRLHSFQKFREQCFRVRIAIWHEDRSRDASFVTLTGPLKGAIYCLVVGLPQALFGAWFRPTNLELKQPAYFAFRRDQPKVMTAQSLAVLSFDL
jgi:hypothetical protein